MGRATNRSFLRLRRLSLYLATGLLMSAFGVGCTSEKEKAQKTITDAVKECRNAEPEGRFYTVPLPLLDGEEDDVLQAVCAKDLDKFEMTSELSAQGFTGPVRWNVRVDEATGVWALYSAEWSNLDRARNAFGKNDPTEENLSYAAEHFAKAQQQMPDNGWIRLQHLSALLDLRMKTRKSDDPTPIGLGEQAQKLYDATVAWAAENDDLDAEVEAQYLAAKHRKAYLNRIDMVLSSDGSSDEWLIKSAEQAEKEGEPEKAAEYRKELEETREKRQQTHKLFSARRKKAKAALCEQLSKLSPAGVDDSDLQQSVVAFKSSVNCMKKAGSVAEGDN
jgi:hypothetical protein